MEKHLLFWILIAIYFPAIVKENKILLYRFPSEIIHNDNTKVQKNAFWKKTNKQNKTKPTKW